MTGREARVLLPQSCFRCHHCQCRSLLGTWSRQAVLVVVLPGALVIPPSTLRTLVASCCHQSQGCQTLFALSVHPAPLQLIPHVRSLLGGGHWPDLTPDIFLLFAITPCITTAKSCSPYSPARAQTTDQRHVRRFFFIQR